MVVLYRVAGLVTGPLGYHVASKGDYVWADFDSVTAPVIVRRPDGSLRPLGPAAVAFLLRHLRDLRPVWADQGVLALMLHTQQSVVQSRAALGELPRLAVAS